jgi:release factor glutamine methyltransferase
MGLDFKINEDVFIPRPETEILVETAINYTTQAIYKEVSSPNILDIGTGSGCIAVSLAKFIPLAEIVATDISLQALEVARKNAKTNSVEIDFIQSNLFENPRLITKNYDLIVSNPPYISTWDILRLPLDVQREPYIALNGGKDGLDFYRELIRECPLYLKENGYLILEMGKDQFRAVCDIVSASRKFEIIEIIKDY